MATKSKLSKGSPENTENKYKKSEKLDNKFNS